jgi:hypothetical protein
VLHEEDIRYVETCRSCESVFNVNDFKLVLNNT